MQALRNLVVIESLCQTKVGTGLSVNAEKFCCFTAQLF